MHTKGSALLQVYVFTGVAQIELLNGHLGLMLCLVYIAEGPPCCGATGPLRKSPRTPREAWVPLVLPTDAQ